MQKFTIDVTTIQRGCVYDGAGVRTTVFLYGCPLRCPWCCNPETWALRADYVDESKCLKAKGVESDICKDCKLYGGSTPVNKCAFGATYGQVNSIATSEIFERLAQDFSLMKSSGGGVTFSGGEPLLQAFQLVPLLKSLKENDIDICFETSLFVPEENLYPIFQFADRFIIDLKLQPEMKLNDHKYLRLIKENLLSIPDIIDKQFRLVVVNSLIGQVNRICEVLKELEIKKLELLRAHNLGSKKYKKLGLESDDFTADETIFSDFACLLTARGVEITKLTI